MILKDLRIVTPFGMIEKGWIRTEGDRIVQIGKTGDGLHFAEDSRTEKIMDMKGLTAFPGFIDIHVHGSAGVDTMDACESGGEALRKIERSLLKTGVTSFLATTVSESLEKIEEVQRVAAEVRSAYLKELDGPSDSEFAIEAELLGVHLEGPFINPAAKGAQNGNYIQKPEADYVAGLDDIVRLITLAPEEDMAHQAIKKALEKGIRVSVGHSRASYEETKKAFDSGVSGVTHLFNGMNPLHHREPGVPMAALEDSRVYVELIADFIHLHPAILRLTKKSKGAGGILLVTDAMGGQCMGAGSYLLGGLAVTVDEKCARLQDGTLAGSILTMEKALQNMKAATDSSLLELALMTSGNQARILGLKDRGTIELGKKADIAFLSEKLELKKVMKNGKFAEKFSD